MNDRSRDVQCGSTAVLRPEPGLLLVLSNYEAIVASTLCLHVHHRSRPRVSKTQRRRGAVICEDVSSCAVSVPSTRHMARVPTHEAAAAGSFTDSSSVGSALHANISSLTIILENGNSPVFRSSDDSRKRKSVWHKRMQRGKVTNKQKGKVRGITFLCICIMGGCIRQADAPRIIVERRFPFAAQQWCRAFMERVCTCRASRDVRSKDLKSQP